MMVAVDRMEKEAHDRNDIVQAVRILNADRSRNETMGVYQNALCIRISEVISHTPSASASYPPRCSEIQR